jgi:hypothetical protein
MNRFRALTAALSLVGIVTFFDASGQAYSTFGKWASTSIPFFLNPQNGSVTADDAETAFKTALDAWSDGTKSPFSYSYGGRVDDTTVGYDGRNVAVFRTEADASELARTYVWSLNGTIVDADIVFSDVRLTFFTGATGCEDAGEGGYIEDLGAHELGHALGLLDSRVIGATMAAAAVPCSQWQRTLDADDVTGLQQLYGAAAVSPSPTNTSASTPASTTGTSSTASTSASSSKPTSPSKPPASTSPEASTTGPRDTQLPASLRQPAQQAASAPANGSGAPQMGAPSSYPPATGSGSPTRATQSAAARPSIADRATTRTSTRGNGTGDEREVAPAGDVPTMNTPPWITITSPTSTTSVSVGQMVTFVGMAVDAEDGKLTGSLVWTSSVAGQIGVGGQFSRVLPAGTHVITATVSDANGAVATQEVTIRVTGPVPTLVPVAIAVPAVAASQGAFAAPLPTATASAYTINRSPRVDLTWSGFAARTVDVFRDGVKVLTTPNDGAFTDKPSAKAAGSYTYKVCVTGTSVCSADSRITF